MYTRLTRAEMGFLARNDALWRGLLFVSIGVYALATAALGVAHPRDVSLFWGPFLAATLSVCYGAFLLLLAYYHRSFWPMKDRIDADAAGRAHSVAWVVLFAALALASAAGALAGHAGSAAAIVVTCWLAGFWAVTGRLWAHYAFFAAVLALAGALLERRAYGRVTARSSLIAGGLAFVGLSGLLFAGRLDFGFVPDTAAVPFEVATLALAGVSLVVLGVIDHRTMRALREDFFGGRL